MKKILIALMLIASFFITAAVNSYAATIPQVKDAHITDTTDIKSDLIEMNLPYDDYLLPANANSNLTSLYKKSKKSYEQFVIAVGENYSDLNDIVSYVYCYSPLYFLVEEKLNIDLTITINKGFSNQKELRLSNKLVDPIKEDKRAGILCFKFTLYDQADLVRTYSVEINNAPGGNVFECTYKTMLDEKNEQRCDNFNFNSLLYITKDNLCAIKVDTWDYNNMFGADWWLNIGDTLLNGASDVSFWFYNFSSSVEIEEILEADISYYSYINVKKYIQLGFIVDTETRDKQLNKVTKYPGVTEQKVFGELCKFNAFATPASSRIDEFKPVEINENYFKDYQHSILIDIGKNRQGVSTTYDDNSSFNGGNIFKPNSVTSRITKPCRADETFEISQFSLTRIKYKTKGVIYNSYVLDTDGPDNSAGTDTPDNPNKNWWLTLIEWIKEHPYETLAIVIGVVVGIPLVIAFLPTLISVIVNLLSLALKALLFVITLPFRILLMPFRRKK